MYIKQMTTTQIKEMLKTMLLLEAKSEKYYNNNLKSIMDETIFDFTIKNGYGSDYIVAKIKNGDMFVFDDCSYIKFEMPNMEPISYQKNTNTYLNYMRNQFPDYYSFEKEYNQEANNIVNIVNFCDDLLTNRVNHSSRVSMEYTY